MNSIEHPSRAAHHGRREHSRARPVSRSLDRMGGALLCLLLIATPWMFGTTEAWSIHLMNGGSCVAAGMFAVSALLDRRQRAQADPPDRLERILRGSFLAVNLLVLLFCLASLLNARASFSIESQSFTYRETFAAWLPTSYDAAATKEALLRLTALFAAFWSLRYWILRGWRRAREHHPELPVLSALDNPRLRVWLWLLSLNGMLVSVQGTLQRLGSSSKLLWMRESWWGDPTSCFGPFSYRGNAAEYLNLVWPVTLGFWISLTRRRRRSEPHGRLISDGPELLLIPSVIMMIAGSIISLSRGGAIVAAAMLASLSALFLFQKHISKRTRAGFILLLTAVAGAVWFLGWEKVKARFSEDGIDLSGREVIYRNSRQIAADYPLFGTGPGTFTSVYHLYRQDTSQPWHGYLHDDWMETRVTFGALGLGLVIAALVILTAWIFVPGKPGDYYLLTLAGVVALAGCLTHAKFDLPFQTHSIFFTFVCIAAALTTITPLKR